VTGIAKNYSNIVENGTFKNWLGQFGETPNNAKIAF
jgi:hypothetical protein